MRPGRNCLDCKFSIFISKSSSGSGGNLRLDWLSSSSPRALEPFSGNEGYVSKGDSSKGAEKVFQFCLNGKKKISFFASFPNLKIWSFSFYSVKKLAISFSWLMCSFSFLSISLTTLINVKRLKWSRDLSPILHVFSIFFQSLHHTSSSKVPSSGNQEL